MANTYVAIATTTVGSGGASSIEFTSIPGTYTDLCILLSARSDESGSSVTNLRWTFNNSTSGYSGLELYAQTSNNTVGSGNGGTTSSYIQLGYANAPLNTASTFSSTMVYIPNYASSNNKSMSLDSVQESNGGAVYVDLGAALWSNSAAITSIKITPLTNNFVQYSTATLYGIKNS
jgi:hypothetical protein